MHGKDIFCDQCVYKKSACFTEPLSYPSMMYSKYDVNNMESNCYQLVTANHQSVCEIRMY